MGIYLKLSLLNLKFTKKNCFTIQHRQLFFKLQVEERGQSAACSVRNGGGAGSALPPAAPRP